MSNSDNNNSIKKTIEKNKLNLNSKSLNESIRKIYDRVVEKQRLNSKLIFVPLEKGTVLTCGQNLIAFEGEEGTNSVCIQMQNHVETRTALRITFSDMKEYFFFLDYLKVWNCRDTISSIRKISSSSDSEDRIEVFYKNYKNNMENLIPFFFDSQRKTDEFYILVKAFRNNYNRKEGAQNYDRFYFSIYESGGAALYGQTNDFDFKFSPEVKFELVCNIDPLWPHNDLH